MRWNPGAWLPKLSPRRAHVARSRQTANKQIPHVAHQLPTSPSGSGSYPYYGYPNGAPGLFPKPALLPTQLAGAGGGFVQLSAGVTHLCALRENGTAACFGEQPWQLQ